MLVSGWQQAVTLLLAIVPGFIYQGTLSRLRGPTPDDREMGVRRRGVPCAAKWNDRCLGSLR